MGGSAVLGTSLVDGLVLTVDSLRAALYPLAGVRPFKVELVRRRWSNGRRGDGLPGEVSAVELTPPPRVQDALRRELQPAGVQEAGDVVLTEVSLAYTDAELTGQPVAKDEEVYYRLTAATGTGQAIAPRYFTIVSPPMPDRERDIGWTIKLRRAEVQE